MTSTAVTQPDLLDASLLARPEWCEFSGNYHRDDEDGIDLRPLREHVIELDKVVAGTDRAPSGTLHQPYALVCVTVQEKSCYDHADVDDPKVAVAAKGYPHFTPGEARLLAASLVEAADRADEIMGQRAPRHRVA